MSKDSDPFELFKQIRRDLGSPVIGVCETPGCDNRGKLGSYDGAFCKMCGKDVKIIRETRNYIDEEQRDKLQKRHEKKYAKK